MTDRRNVVPLPRRQDQPKIEGKSCSTCREWKPLSEFNRMSRRRDGHRAVCRGCQKQQQASYRARNRSVLSEKKKEYKRRNAEKVAVAAKIYSEKNKDRIATRGKEWYRKNAALVASRNKSLRQSDPDRFRRIEAARKRNPEDSLEYQRRYRASEKGKIKSRLASSRRRAVLRGIGGSYTRSEWEAQIERQKAKCYHCGGKFTEDRPATIDHLLPIAAGGEHAAHNIVASCGPCNSRKGAKRIVLL